MTIARAPLVSKVLQFLFKNCFEVANLGRNAFKINYHLGSLQPENPLKVSIDQLTRAVEALLQLHTNSCSSSAAISPEESKSTKEAWTATEHLQFTIFAAHGISSGWVSK